MLNPVSQGTWRETYTHAGKPITIQHQGGPADAVQLTIPRQALTEARFYAPVAERRRRRVILHRYTRHSPIDLDVLLYVYSGTDERAGPVAGHKDSPAWS